LIACQTVSPTPIESTSEPPKAESDIDILLSSRPELAGRYFKTSKEIVCIEKTLLHQRVLNVAKEIPYAMWYSDLNQSDLDKYSSIMMFINNKTRTVSVLEYIIKNDGELKGVLEGVYACVLTSGIKLFINNKKPNIGTNFKSED